MLSRQKDLLQHKDATYNLLKGKKILVIGDSMVYGNNLGTENSWTKRFADINGLQYEVNENGNTDKDGGVVINAGVNGCCLSYNNAPFVTNITKSIIARYPNMDNDADYVIVFGGTNDEWGISRNEIQMGTEDSIDNTTFNGALNVLMDGLMTKYPKAKIAFITPHNEKKTQTRAGVVEAIKKACIRNGGLPCFDNVELGGGVFGNAARMIALTQTTDVSNPNGHLNIDGLKFIATKYDAWIKGL